MQVRLAFSVAIHAHAPIILLDEVMAVGDANFQSKCQREFNKLKKEGRTTVFVTHDMESVKKHCNKVVLLSKGKIVASGSPEKATYDYLGLNLEEANRDKSNNSDDEWGNRKGGHRVCYDSFPR
jgi:ABC-2 type transport system ATP-binding protein